MCFRLLIPLYLCTYVVYALYACHKTFAEAKALPGCCAAVCWAGRGGGGSERERERRVRTSVFRFVFGFRFGIGFGFVLAELRTRTRVAWAYFSASACSARTPPAHTPFLPWPRTLFLGLFNHLIPHRTLLISSNQLTLKTFVVYSRYLFLFPNTHTHMRICMYIFIVVVFVVGIHARCVY